MNNRLLFYFVLEVKEDCAINHERTMQHKNSLNLLQNLPARVNFPYLLQVMMAVILSYTKDVEDAYKSFGRRTRKCSYPVFYNFLSNCLFVRHIILFFPFGLAFLARHI